MVLQCCLNLNLRGQNSAVSLPIQIPRMGGSLRKMCLSAQVATTANSSSTRESTSETAGSLESSISLQDGKKKVIEERWRQFFSDPSQWWDHRVGKASPKYPDFKHKTTEEGLWIHHRSNPQWVEAELATITPGTVQLPIVFWNKKLARFVRDGQHSQALEIFQQMQEDGRNPDTFTYVPVLKACGSLGALEEGRKVHTQIIQSGFESNLFVGTSLIDMYAECGSTEDAEKVFNELPVKDVFIWTAMIVGYVKCGEGQKGLEVYEQMQLEGVEPGPVTFVGVLNACASILALEWGRHVHTQIMQSGCELNPFVANSLLDMYGKCGAIGDAHNLFMRMPTRSVVSWTVMIMGYVKCGEGRKALELYKLMQVEQVEPVPATFVGVLNACASVGALKEGRRVHEKIVQSGCESDVFVGTSLIDMYAKCGSIDEAWRVFNKLPNRNVVSWNAMITGYVQSGKGKAALELYYRMQMEEVEPAPITFVGAINACASLLALEEGRCIHSQIIERQCESNAFVSTSLVDMYIKCESIEDAQKVFDKMDTRDTIAWTVMIMGYVKYGQGQKALQLCQQMQLDGLEPAPDTFHEVLRACANEAKLAEGPDDHS